MKPINLSHFRGSLAASLLLVIASFAQAQAQAQAQAEKLSSSTIALAKAFAPSRDIGDQQHKRVAAQLRKLYNISGPDDDPVVSLIVTTKGLAKLSTFSRIPHVFAQYKSGHRAFIRARFTALEDLAKLRDVKEIVPDSVKQAPRFRSDVDLVPPRPVIASSRDLGAANPVAFDAQGMTGKGIAVGIVDSGIDWRHPDFVNEDGTSRIVAIWDLTDTSYKDGKGGSKPPVEGLGTLYTNDQINEALKGNATIGTTDTFGHGTACAGIAGGSGRGKVSGVAAGYYKGVAPEADLIIARVGTDGSYTNTELASAWVADTAAARKEPLSLSLSFGSSYSGHSGADDTEKIYADMSGTGKQGISVVVAAGNDGLHAAHAGGKISPSMQGAASHDFHAKALFETDGMAIAVFNKQDDWALDLTADEVLDTTPTKEFLADGKRLWLSVKADGDKVKVSAHDQDGKDIPPSTEQQALFESALITQGDTVIVTLHLAAGKYWLYPRGDSSAVTDGAVDFYIISGRGEFISGATNEHLVSSPGNSTNVITVGAYNLLAEWMTPGNVDVNYNIGKGDIAQFSSGGYRRDGTVKPDICAPGNFMISAKSATLGMPHDDGDLVAGGDYLAWAGTSASTPYAAGVIALMLQKNPKLDIDQIRAILKQSATTDQLTGGVPNPAWGWGKLNPEAAIKAVGG